MDLMPPLGVPGCRRGGLWNLEVEPFGRKTCPQNHKKGVPERPSEKIVNFERNLIGELMLRIIENIDFIFVFPIESCLRPSVGKLENRTENRRQNGF